MKQPLSTNIRSSTDMAKIKTKPSLQQSKTLSINSYKVKKIIFIFEIASKNIVTTSIYLKSNRFLLKK